jgi:hypothetical protein
VGDQLSTGRSLWAEEHRAFRFFRTGSNSMSDGTITVRISQKHATFLQANLAALATATRQAMTRPGLEAGRRTTLGSRAVLLETIEDAVRGALVEVPQALRKTGRSPESAVRVENQRITRNFGAAA